jgi:CRISPR-associated protein Cas5d
MKVERFSYPVITPSAARGILDSIYVKPPEFSWRITTVEMLRPPSFISLRRNEMKNKAPHSTIQGAMTKKHSSLSPLFADEDNEGTGRTQRQTIALSSVDYLIWCKIRPWPACNIPITALDAQFKRRAQSGKCFCQPCLGCREFPAYFEYVEDRSHLPPPAPVDFEIGWMIYDVFDLSQPNAFGSNPSVSLFWATVKQGVLEVPPYESEAVKKVK